MGSFCEIKGFTPSQRTVEGLREMESVLQAAHILTTLLSVTPLFQIFAGRGDYIGLGAGASAYNISVYDWESLAQAFKGINDLKRKRFREIVFNERNYATGKDKAFWECMDHAVK